MSKINHHKGYKYTRFQKRVFEKDGHKCVLCGSTEDITVDHIVPRVQCPALFWDINNGRTLCDKCRVKNDLNLWSLGELKPIRNEVRNDKNRRDKKVSTSVRV